MPHTSHHHCWWGTRKESVEWPLVRTCWPTWVSTTQWKWGESVFRNRSDFPSYKSSAKFRCRLKTLLLESLLIKHTTCRRESTLLTFLWEWGDRTQPLTHQPLLVTVCSLLQLTLHLSPAWGVFQTFLQLFQTTLHNIMTSAYRHKQNCSGEV